MKRKKRVRTKYVELIALDNVPAFAEPIGPGYQVAFDETIATAGFSEIRLWVHIFATNYETTPVTSAARLTVRFMHQFGGGSFHYEEGTIPYNGVTSYINGYCAQPIIGDRLRLWCHPENLPPGPYQLYVTYYLVR
jgi:hypothetical protein